MSFKESFDKTAFVAPLARGAMSIAKGLGKGVAKTPKTAWTASKAITKAPKAAYKGVKSTAKHTGDFVAGPVGAGFFAMDSLDQAKSISNARKMGLGQPYRMK